MDSNYSLPQNVALITLQVTVNLCRNELNAWHILLSLAHTRMLVLQELDDGSVLVRLAHLYEVKG